MARSLLDRQLSRARRRLFLTTLLGCLAWGWLLAVACAAGWFLAQPYLVREAPEALRWVVLSSLGGLATVLAALLAARIGPSPVAAALALDDRFGLKERVTTSLTLGPDESATPAARALLADVEGRLASVRVGDRFPVRLPRLPAALLSVAVLALVLVALFWAPDVGAGGPGDDDALAAAPAVKADLDEQVKKLAAPRPAAKKSGEPARPEDLERIDAEIERFTRKRRDTREEVRERIKDATELEGQIRREQKQQADRLDAFKEAMKQVQRLRRKDREQKKEGPAGNAADALARGDLGRA